MKFVGTESKYYGESELSRLLDLDSCDTPEKIVATYKVITSDIMYALYNIDGMIARISKAISMIESINDYAIDRATSILIDENQKLFFALKAKYFIFKNSILPANEEKFYYRWKYLLEAMRKREQILNHIIQLSSYRRFEIFVLGTDVVGEFEEKMKQTPNIEKDEFVAFVKNLKQKIKAEIPKELIKHNYLII